MRTEPAAEVGAGEVEHARAEVAPLARDLAANLEMQHRERRATRLFPAPSAHRHVVAEEARRAALVEDVGDGGVGRHALQGDDGRLHQRVVHVGAVAHVRQVGRRARERFVEGGLEVDARRFPRHLQRPRRILEDLHRLQAGDLGEEPAAARVHELGVALQLAELQRADAVALL